MKIREALKTIIGIIAFLAILPLMLITQYAYIQILKKKGVHHE